ncbi:MAG: peptidoglycan DD-metalloendopeptidase family protein [Balneolaceae bacterium]
MLVLLMTALPLFAQSAYEERRLEINEKQETTRSQIENLQEQISSYRERLGYATERYDRMYGQYEELTRVIALQEEKIRQMNREQQQIEEEISLVETELQTLEEELNALIDEYKSTLTYLYKYGRTNELALLLTSTSVNQLLIRSYYLNRFDEYQQQQAGQIREAQAEYEQTREELEQTRERNREALASIQEETRELEQQEQQQKRNIELLQRDRDNLETQVQIRQNQLDELSEALDELIAEEERLEEEEARSSAPVTRARPVSEDEMSEFESQFESLRGNLPWPVDNGVITERFGERVHPVFGTRTNVPGVDIATQPRSTVRAVSDGYVFEIVPFPDFGEVVLVKHGTYYTAYGNMSSIYARKNQLVQQGDVIGLSGDEDNLRGEVLFFLVRVGSNFVDPELWLQESIQ